MEEVFALNNIRIKFIRGENVKFISHLDLMQVFERALRRAHLPIAYSQGFNPHPHIVFGLPLSVGVTSQAEYADFELMKTVTPENFLERLNGELPEGLKILTAASKESKDNVMATIGAASYEILVSTVSKTGKSELEESMKRLLQESEIIVKKEGKKGVKDVNIKSMILKLELNDLNGQTVESEGLRFLKDYIEAQRNPALLPPSYSLENLFYFSAQLSAGSVANLKPELLFVALNEFFNHGMKLVKIHRSGLFVSARGVFKDPLDESVLLG